MDDPMAGGHQIHRARLDHQIAAQRIAVPDRTIEQIGDGRQVDMRMRAHIDPGSGQELRRTHLVEEYEGADHRPLLVGQRPMHLEPAQIMTGRL